MLGGDQDVDIDGAARRDIPVELAGEQAALEGSARIPADAKRSMTSRQASSVAAPHRRAETFRNDALVALELRKVTATQREQSFPEQDDEPGPAQQRYEPVLVHSQRSADIAP